MLDRSLVVAWISDTRRFLDLLERGLGDIASEDPRGGETLGEWFARWADDRAARGAATLAHTASQDSPFGVGSASGHPSSERRAQALSQSGFRGGASGGSGAQAQRGGRGSQESFLMMA